jgi:hypothetical protein
MAAPISTPTSPIIKPTTHRDQHHHALRNLRDAPSSGRFRLCRPLGNASFSVLTQLHPLTPARPSSPPLPRMAVRVLGLLRPATRRLALPTRHGVGQPREPRRPPHGEARHWGRAPHCVRRHAGRSCRRQRPRLGARVVQGARARRRRLLYLSRGNSSCLHPPLAPPLPTAFLPVLPAGTAGSQCARGAPGW